MTSTWKKCGDESLNEEILYFPPRMKAIIAYIRSWVVDIDKRVLLITSLFTALLVFLNYFYFLDSYISSKNSFLWTFLLRFLVFFLAFVIPYLLYRFISRKPYPSHPSFVILLFL